MWCQKRVEEMEERLNMCQEQVEIFRRELAVFAEIMDDYRALYQYYGSEMYHADVDAMQSGQLPDSVRAGVLTEDLLYNLIGDMEGVKADLAELLAKMLRI